MLLRRLLIVASLGISLAAEELSRGEEQRRFDELLRWLEAGIKEAGLEGKHKPLEETFELTWGHYGRALAAKRDVAEGELLALLPSKCLIFDRDYGRQEGLEELEAWQQAPVFLARQKALGKDSPWAPFFNMIPDSNPGLPKYWISLLSDHLQGSDFQEYVEEKMREEKSDWEKVRTFTDISWEEYSWGHETFETRSTYWNGTEKDGSLSPRRIGTSAMYPLYDLFPHILPANVDYGFSSDLQAVQMRAMFQLKKGDIFSIGYFRDGQRFNRDILQKWGFASDDARKVATITVGPSDGVPEGGEDSGDRQALPFALEMTLNDGAAQAFLSVLRARAANRAPLDLQRDLPPEIVGVPDPATGWVYWWDQSTGNTSWVLPGDPDKPYFTPATTWDIEVGALKAAQSLLVDALEWYPHSLAEDTKFLKMGIEDPREKFVVMVRRDEKEVLSWWLHLVRHALAMQGEPDEQVDVNMVYEYPETHEPQNPEPEGPAHSQRASDEL